MKLAESKPHFLGSSLSQVFKNICRISTLVDCPRAKGKGYLSRTAVPVCLSLKATLQLPCQHRELKTEVICKRTQHEFPRLCRRPDIYAAGRTGLDPATALKFKHTLPLPHVETIGWGDSPRAVGRQGGSHHMQSQLSPLGSGSCCKPGG